MTVAKTETDSGRSILIEKTNGTRIIVGNVPTDAKITFGPVQPGSKDFSRSENALRIYKAANNQMGVWLQVASFRDLSLTVKTETVVTEETAKAETSSHGRKSTTKQRQSREWSDD